ncbi:MAG TPA: oligosaccharide flippase family protein [Phycisphaerae bacterium]|nr:oligosaccharide flippase family protein [Phycisphaerae bacterium]
MSKLTGYLQRIGPNWVARCANLAVLFVLSPFVVHRLGVEAYGVWSLLVSLTGYLGLIELGTRGGLGRFIPFYMGRNNPAGVNGVINTTIGFFIACGAVLMLVAGGLAASVEILFARIPADYVASARLVILLIALNLWASFLGTPFALILTALERFGLARTIDMGTLAARAAGVVIVLVAGGGLIGLAIVELAANLLWILANYVAARRVYRPLRLGVRLAGSRWFREVFGFSIWAFVGNVSVNIIYSTDLLLVGLLIGVREVAIYSVPLMLIQHAQHFFNEINAVLGPPIVKAAGAGRHADLRWLFLRGARASVLLGLPFLIGFMVFGGEFIVLWMGPEFADGTRVLTILALAQVAAVATSITTPVISGLGRVRYAALVVTAQAVSNLALSLFFVTQLGLGLEGIALGTLIPMVVFYSVLAGAVMRWLRVSLSSFISQAIVPGGMAAGLFAVMAVAGFRLPGHGQWIGFVLKVTCLGAAYALMARMLLFYRVGATGRQGGAVAAALVTGASGSGARKG